MGMLPLEPWACRTPGSALYIIHVLYFYQFFLYYISSYNLIVDDNYHYYQSLLSNLY